MKKTNLLFILAILFSLLPLSSCTSCKNDVKDTPVTYNFEECYNNDYQYMLDNYGDSNFVMYLAEAHFDTFISYVNPDSMIINEIIVLFQLTNSDSCIVFTHPYRKFDSDSVVIEIVNGSWLECAPIDVNDTAMITLDKAVSAIQSWDGIKPISNICLLRVPIYPPFPKEGYYFFGDDAYFVIVNSHTGFVIDDKSAINAQSLEGNITD